MSREVMEKLNIADCAEISVRISQYCVYLKRQSNQTKSRINWINSYIRSAICDKVNNYFGRWENQDAAAIKDNDTLRKLDAIRNKLQRDYDEIDGISYVLQNLAENFKNLSFAKRQELKSND